MLSGFKEKLAGLGEGLRERVNSGAGPITGAVLGEIRNDGSYNIGEENQKTPSPDKSCLVSGAVPSAGSEVLSHYQEAWARIHQGAADVQGEAEAADKAITSLHSSISSSWRCVSQLSSLLPSCLPPLHTELEGVMKKLAELENLFMEVELSLLALEDTIDLREAEERQLESRFQLALHTERRRQELEELEQQLEAAFRRKRREKEEQDVVRHRERQRMLQTKFQEELSQYSLTGSVERSGSNIGESSPEVSLESIDLEDAVAQEGLEKFLQEDCPQAEQLPKDDIPITQNALCPPSPIERVATVSPSPIPSPEPEAQTRDILSKDAPVNNATSS